ncbi:MAG TPA: Ig-like domain-containing protein, partial [Pyrinomonadaceae bacterium]
YYTATTPTIHNRISRFTASGDVALAGSETIIMELPNLSSATNHNGGAIHFGPDGNLYVAVGVTRVEFLVNGSLQCTDTTAPYTCNWRVPSAPNKTHTLQARAFDQAGNSATAAVTVRSN